MTRRFGRHHVLLAASAAAMLTLAACGGDSASDEASDAVSAGGSAVEEATDAAGGAAGGDGEILVGLITKTDTNPFFVKMKEGAQAKADELGIELQTFAGTKDGDNDTQVAAIDTLIAAGADGILLTASDTSAIVAKVEEARAAGILVIALDTPLQPVDAADATFATDNFKAGELIGQWALAKLGDDAANAKIALLDLNANGVSVDVARNQGFLTGFGIDTADDTQNGDEDDPRIVGNEVTDGSEEGGLTAMETLLAQDPDINLVYTINEPAAQGAYQALQSAGKEGVIIVSVDGGCPGVENVEAGIIGATSMQFPLDMAGLGVEAIAQFAEDGTVPEPTEGLDFFDTGVNLITDEPFDGIESEDSAWGLDNCWG